MMDLWNYLTGRKRKNQCPQPEIETKVYKNDPKPPGIPQCVVCLSESVTLMWNEPKCDKNKIQRYELNYKINSEDRWSSVTSQDNSNSFVVNGLKSNSCYEFKVRAIYDDGKEGQFSEIGGNIVTMKSLSETILDEAQVVKTGHPSIYKLSLKVLETSVDIESKTRKCIFGEQLNDRISEKTIMVVGATGSGKSTLIDGMVNYILNVKWEDDWRFTIIDLMKEENEKKDNQTESQTEWITCYTIHSRPGSRLDYTLNIIDTPGFGDTRGIEKDQAIVDQIRELFTTSPPRGIQTLDAVCFVTQAPLARLSPHQRYIFDSILSIFGKDISKNILVLITFADGNVPPVIQALEGAKVPFERSFKFNNSALFVNTKDTEEGSFGHMFWKMGNESFSLFFSELGKIETRSLQLTSDVLQARKHLEATIQGLMPQIHEGLNVINTIKQEKRVIEQHQADILANKEFEYEVEEVHQRKVDLAVGQYVTNCLTCNKTCHYPCTIPDDIGKQHCSAMSNLGYCTSCPQGCIWSQHVNNQYRFEVYFLKVKKTFDDLKAKYDIALGKEREHSTILEKVKERLNQVCKSVFSMIKRARDCINELNQKALKQNPLSQVDYIELLIKAEEGEAKYGWQKRVEMLKKLSERAELLKNIPNEEFRPWTDEELDDLLQESEDYKSWI